MKIRVFLGILFGAVFSFWSLWLYMLVAFSGTKVFSGFVSGRFDPEFFASMYAPPILLVVLGFFAFRPVKAASDAQD